MSKVIIKQHLNTLKSQIDAQMAIVRGEAEKAGIDVTQLKYSDGKWPWVDLLLAKAQVLNALAVLEANK